MNPYIYTTRATEKGDSVVSLCCGVGFEFVDCKSKDITGVDIHPKYLERVNRDFPHVKTINANVVEWVQTVPDNSYDVVSFLDGLEHITKEEGLLVLEHCKRICRKEVIVFTQIGYLKNEPHNAWGIEGGDEYQKHRSGWEVSELADKGYTLIDSAKDISQHGEPYTAVVYKYSKV